MRNKQENLKILEEENQALREENASLKKLLESKRYVVAKKIANSYNSVLPVGTRRRELFANGYKLIKKTRRKRIEKNISLLQEKVAMYEKIIVVSGTSWKAPLPQRSHQLTKEFAKQRDVLVIYYEMGDLANSVKIIADNLVLVESSEIILSIKISNKQSGYFMFSNVGDIKLDNIYVLKGNGFKLIYECIDELDESLSGGISINQKQIIKELPNLDVSLYTSTAGRLTDQLRKIVPDASILISKNAVNVEDFSFQKYSGKNIPNDMKTIMKKGKPIVGYYGAISPWLDYDLIHAIAKKYQNFEFVMIGVDYDGALERLDRTITNINYLGGKKQSLLPRYAVNFDCGIIPFVEGKIAKSTSPIKLFEYMALGLPTVCTRDLVECKGYEYVYVSEDEDAFEKNLNKAINQSKNIEVRRKLLKQSEENTWDIRAKEILKSISFIN